MEFVAGIALLVGIFWAAWRYRKYLERSIAPRVIETALTAEQLLRVFDASVARASWTIIDTGNPRVAQSSIITEMRNQISLTIDGTEDGKQIAVVQIPRLVLQLGNAPAKTHTLRMRMNAFIDAVQACDDSARIAVKTAR